MAWEMMKEGGARQRGRGMYEEADLDESGLDVRLEAGTGHMRVDLDTHIPIGVLIDLFERIGFTVVPADQVSGSTPKEGT